MASATARPTYEEAVTAMRGALRALSGAVSRGETAGLGPAVYERRGSQQYLEEGKQAALERLRRQGTPDFLEKEIEEDWWQTWPVDTRLAFVAEMAELEHKFETRYTFIPGESVLVRPAIGL